MKLSEIFIAAKAHLAMTAAEEHGGKTEYICHAIERAAEYDGTVSSALRLVEKRLAPHSTANAWLVYVAGVDADIVYGERGAAGFGFAKPQVQQWRAAWLDQLAAEFAAKGD